MKKRNVILFLIVIVLLAAGYSLQSRETNSESDNAAPTVKDTVTLAVNMVATSIDPHDIASLVHNQIKAHVYESFYHFNDIVNEYEPRLATGHTVSDNGLVYTFDLRKGVKFHNGEEMKASDVIFSIDRAKKAASLNQYTAPIESYVSSGDYSVVITLKEAFSPFIHHSKMIFIVSEKAVQETGDGNMKSTVSPAGTGPYKIASYKPDTAIEYEAFKDYYRGEAKIKKIISKPFTDTSTGLIAFQNGELDFYTVPLPNWKEIVDSGKYGTKLVAANHISYFRMNPGRAPFTDVKVRQAIAHCLNRTAQINVAYEGLAEEAKLMYNPKYIFGAPENGVVYDYDIEKAKQLLAEAGYPNGLDIGSIKTAAGLYFEKMTQNLQATLAEAGITSTVEAMEQSSLITDLTNNDFGMVTTGYACQYDYDFVRVVIDLVKDGYSADIYNDVRPMFAQAAKEADPEKRKELYQQIDNKLMELCVFIPVFYKTNPYAWDSGMNVDSGPLYYYVYDWSWK